MRRCDRQVQQRGAGEKATSPDVTSSSNSCLASSHHVATILLLLLLRGSIVMVLASSFLHCFHEYLQTRACHTRSRVSCYDVTASGAVTPELYDDDSAADSLFCTRSALLDPSCIQCSSSLRGREDWYTNHTVDYRLRALWCSMVLCEKWPASILRYLFLIVASSPHYSFVRTCTRAQMTLQSYPHSVTTLPCHAMILPAPCTMELVWLIMSGQVYAHRGIKWAEERVILLPLSNHYTKANGPEGKI